MQPAVLYLDANATSRLRPEATAALARAMADERPMNPSSVHACGRAGRKELRSARDSVLRLLAAPDASLTFTSGATEACNTMVLGLLGGPARAARHPGHAITTAIEHPAVYEAFDELEANGWTVTRVVPGRDGVVSADELAAAVRPDTALVALMAANNETGAIQPLARTVRLLRANRFGGPIVSDATQCAGRVPFDLGALFRAGLTAAAVSGHKMGAPAGIGALIVAGAYDRDRCFELSPLIRGGRQESATRGGTENLLGAIAFGGVAAALEPRVADEAVRLAKLRDRLAGALIARVPEIVRLTPEGNDPDGRPAALPNTFFFRVPGCRGDDLVVGLDLEGVSASVGSACASGKQEPSHVVRAMGLGDDAAREVVRFSLDWDADESLVDRAVEITDRVIARMRSAPASTTNASVAA